MKHVNEHAGARGTCLYLACLTVMLTPSAAWAAGETAQIHATSTFIDDVARGVLPVAIAVPAAWADVFAGAQAATLAELRYCGVGEKAAGRFRAVILPHGVRRTQSLLAIRSRCDARLADLADLAESAGPLLRQGQSLVIADVEATFKASQIELFSARAVVVHGGAGKADPVTLDNRTLLATVSTSGLPFDLAGSPMFIRIAPSFSVRSVDFAVALTERASDKSPLERSVPMSKALLDAGAGVALDLPLSTANFILRRLTGSKPVTVTVQGDTIELRDVAIKASGSGATAAVSVAGSATPQSIRETVDWSLRLVGDPLSVQSVQAAAHVEACGGLSTLAAIACDLRNGTRVAAVEALAAAMTNQYRGRTVHELVSPFHTSMTVADRRIDLSGDLLRVAGRGLAILASGNVSASAGE